MTLMPDRSRLASYAHHAGHGTSPVPDTTGTTPAPRRPSDALRDRLAEWTAANKAARDAYHARPEKCGECGRWTGGGQHACPGGAA